MIIRWRKLAILGVAISLPILAFKAGQKYAISGDTLANCDRCKKLIEMRTAERLARHLIRDHKQSEEDAYNTVEWLYKKLFKTIKKVK